MAGLTHLGVGLAAKKAAPRVPLAVLIIGAYAIDIIWGVFYFTGIESAPQLGIPAPWSHGLFMSIVWSMLLGLFAWMLSREKRISIIIGLLVFSHWLVDFIAKPMLVNFPNDAGLPLLFYGSPTVGLGLWSFPFAVYVGEYGGVLLGLMIYIHYRMKLARVKQESLKG